MQIVGKVKIDDNQLRNTLRDGLPRVEIQMFDEFDTKSVRELAAKVREHKGVIVESIHTPLRDSDTKLEDLFNDYKRMDIINTIELADLIGSDQDYYPKVVVHSDLDMGLIEDCKSVKDRLILEVTDVLERFGRVNLSLENSSPLQRSKDGNLRTRKGTVSNIRKLASMLKEETCSSRIGITLDVCHMLAEINLGKMLQKMYPINTYSISDIFESTRGLIDNIHLCDINNLGMTGETHGTPFLLEDKELLKEVLTQCELLPNRVNLVLEIGEEEYVDNSNRNKLLTIITLNSLTNLGKSNNFISRAL